MLKGDLKELEKKNLEEQKEQLPKQQTVPFDIMDELAKNPVQVPGIRSITREEMHD